MRKLSGERTTSRASLVFSSFLKSSGPKMLAQPSSPSRPHSRLTLHPRHHQLGPQSRPRARHPLRPGRPALHAPRRRPGSAAPSALAHRPLAVMLQYERCFISVMGCCFILYISENQDCSQLNELSTLGLKLVSTPSHKSHFDKN
jgi:hypothetical protein